MFQSDSELRIEFLNKTQVDDFTMATVGCPLSVRLSVPLIAERSSSSAEARSSAAELVPDTDRYLRQSIAASGQRQCCDPRIDVDLSQTMCS